jgi:hypothetical protein
MLFTRNVDEAPPSSRGAYELTPAQTAMAALLGVIGVCIIAASFRVSDRATLAAREAAEAPARFLNVELAQLKAAAIRGESRVAARLYFGIEECFRSTHAVPFDPENLRRANETLTACAENQLGTLHAAGGSALVREGRLLLQSLSLLR